MPGRSACPIYLWFYVGALKAVFLSSFSGIKTSVQVSAAYGSSLVTSSSALPDGCQPRPDATLTEPVQFDDFIQLSRGSFAASV